MEDQGTYIKNKNGNALFFNKLTSKVEEVPFNSPEIGQKWLMLSMKNKNGIFKLYPGGAFCEMLILKYIE